MWIFKKWCSSFEIRISKKLLEQNANYLNHIKIEAVSIVEEVLKK